MRQTADCFRHGPYPVDESGAGECARCEHERVARYAGGHEVTTTDEARDAMRGAVEAMARHLSDNSERSYEYPEYHFPAVAS